jgi:DNA-directed RNA polymerase subunit RPC12/RpoP
LESSVLVPITIGGIAMIAVLAPLLLLRRRNLATGRRRSAAAAATDDYRKSRDKADLGLLCPACGGVAEPLRQTHDCYSCVACGHQFRAERHEWQDA